MNKPLESVLVHLFRVPVGPPAAPSGAYAKVEIMRASPRYLRYRLIGVALFTLLFAAVLFAIAVGALISGEGEPWIAFVVVFAIGTPLLVCAYLATRIDFDLRYYVITDRSLRVRQGAWVLDEKTITFANVQNVRVTQGPLQRLFGISDVRVDTAGGGSGGKPHGLESSHNVVIAGIENAAAVRDEIVAHSRRRGRGAGLGDLDDERARPTEFASAHVAALRELAASARELRRAAASRVG